jgi:hypothetical protein
VITFIGSSFSIGVKVISFARPPAMDGADLQIAAVRLAVILSSGCRGKPAGKQTPHEN